MRFGDTADNCTQSIAGTVRYSTSQNALEVCNGSAWLLLVTAGMDETVVSPARDCLDILKSGMCVLTIFYHTHAHQSNIVDSCFYVTPSNSKIKELRHTEFRIFRP